MRAIILAAGKGTRLRPITYKTPKPLVKVANKPIIEKQIEYLLQSDIKDIIIVSGYKKEKLDYLKEKYNVKIVYNPNYNEYNNIYSMYLVKNYLEDTYVLDGDVYINKNIFNKDINKSTYFGIYKSNFQNEWVISADNKNKIKDISIESSQNKYILSGISYWNKDDGRFLQRELDGYINNKNNMNLYWDNVVKDNINNIHIYLNPLTEHTCYEIDNIEELEHLRNILNERLIK